MDIEIRMNSIPLRASKDEIQWEDLASQLRLFVRSFIYRARVTLWKGQEEDLLEDIVQETLCRVINYTQKAGAKATSISTLQRISVVVARNYCIDRWRKDHRLLRLFSTPPTEEVWPPSYTPNEDISSFDAAVEQAYQEELFHLVAQKVSRFPPKQRDALLIDLANHMQFGRELTAVQKAFLSSGVDLKRYQRPPFQTFQERTRQSALVSIAYQRVARCMQEDL